MQQYVDFNLRLKLPLPDGIEEYQFLLGHISHSTATKPLALMKKQSPVFTSEFQVITVFSSHAASDAISDAAKF